MFGDRVFIRLPLPRRTTSAGPSLRLSNASQDARLYAIRSRRWLPLKAVTLGATPRAQVRIEVCGFAGHDNRVSRCSTTHCTLDQQVPAFGERERAEVYLHCISTLPMKVSIVWNRSTAAASCA